MPSTSRSSLTTAPRTAPAVAPSVPTSAAPQRTGNAAAQERTGTTAPAPEPAGCLDAAIDAMGEMAAVVLDAMPLRQALPLAWSRRDEPWAEGWIRAQQAEQVLRFGGDLLLQALDRVWPVGLGIELDAMLGAKLLVEGALSGGIGVERAADTFLVRFRGTVTPAAAIGMGMKLTGAGDEAALGGDLEAKLGRAFGVELEWSLGVQELLSALVDARPTRLQDLLWGAANPASLVAESLGKLMTALPADKARLSDAVQFDIGAEAAMGGASDFAAKQHHEAGYAVGVEDGAVYAEAHISQSTSFGTHNWLLSRILPLADFAASHEGELRVRAKGTREQIARQDVAALSYEVTTITAGVDTRVEDTACLEGWDAFARYLCALANPVDQLFGDAGAPVPAEALPDVALNRGVERVVGDLRELEAEVPGVAGVLRDAAGNLLGSMDRFSDHALADLDLQAELTGKVRVPVDAVRAAIGGGSLTPGPEGIEARVLDVARVVAAKVVGGSAPEHGLPALDIEAAAEEVDTDGIELLARTEARAGIGGDVALGAVTGAKVDAGLALTWRTSLEALSPEEQRKLLVG